MLSAIIFFSQSTLHFKTNLASLNIPRSLHSPVNIDMSFNRILKKVSVGSTNKAGQEIALSVATQTSDWLRPESVALQQGPGFKSAVEASKQLIPLGTKEVCQRSKGTPLKVLSGHELNFNREAQHKSDDPRDHYTGVCFDDKGEGKSVHFPVKG